MSELTSKELDLVIRRVNDRIPRSVTPETRIEIHPSDWLTLVDAARSQPAHEPAQSNSVDSIGAVSPRRWWCAHGWLFGHGCSQCPTGEPRADEGACAFALRRIRDAGYLGERFPAYATEALDAYPVMCDHGAHPHNCTICTPRLPVPAGRITCDQALVLLKKAIDTGKADITISSGGVQAIVDLLEAAQLLLCGTPASRPPPLSEHPDTTRLNFLESQRKWGDCFAVMDLDSGDVYVRPWKIDNQSHPGRFAARLVATTMRDVIDAEMHSASTKRSDAG